MSDNSHHLAIIGTDDTFILVIVDQSRELSARFRLIWELLVEKFAYLVEKMNLLQRVRLFGRKNEIMSTPNIKAYFSISVLKVL